MSTELECEKTGATFTRAFDDCWGEERSREPAIAGFKGRLLARGLDQVAQRLL